MNNRSRKYRLSPQEKSQLRRIKSAVALIESGAITPYKDGEFWVRTERMNIPYRVSTTSCQCVDFILNQKPCKHIWAAIAGVVVLLVRDIQEAHTMEELMNSHKPYSDSLGALPDTFLEIARAQYAARRCELTSQLPPAAPPQPPMPKRKPVPAHPLDERILLIKPQPKSNGRVDGIEI